MKNKFEVSDCAKKLKTLREQTGLSLAKVADALNYPTPSGYNHYETRYKKRYLPQDLVLSLIPLFEPYGVARQDLLALAGLDVLLMEEQETRIGGKGKGGNASINTSLYTRVVLEVVSVLQDEKAYADLTQQEIDKVAAQVYNVATEYKTDLINRDIVRWMINVMYQHGELQKGI